MVFLLCLAAKYEDVIHVDDHNAFIDELSEDVIHHHLECHQAVSETKEHDKGFKQASVCPKGCLPLVSILDSHIVVYPSDVQFGEVLHFGSGHHIEDVGDQGQGVGILHGQHVELTVVLDEVEASVLFLNEEDGGGHGQFGWVYVSALEVLIKELIWLLLLNWCQRVDLSVKCLSIQDQFYGMVPFLPIWE